MRFLSPVPLCLMFCFATALPVCADDTLTLDLPPSQAALDLRAAERAKQRAATEDAARQAALARQQRAASSGRGFSMPPSRGGKSERVVGRLGELANAASIYRSRSVRSGKLTTAPAGTYVAIEDDAGDWYGILMADRSVGWLPHSAVTLLDYQVVSTGSNSSLPAFGGSDSYARTAGAYFQGDSQRLISDAYRYLGVPYHWGGTTTDGLDCSAFMKNVFAANGYPLPRTAAEQVGVGLPVTPDQLQPGDRIYFGHGNISHTGLYIGNGYFIHASSAHHRVVVSQLSESLYTRLYACARR